MSTISIEKNCEFRGANIGRERCIEELITPKKVFFALGHDYTLPLSKFTYAELQDLATDPLVPFFALPKAVGIADLAQAEVEISQNDFGMQFLTKGQNWTNFKMKMEIGGCNLRALQVYNNQPVTFFIFNEVKGQVELIEKGGNVVAKGFNGRLYMEAFKMKANPNDTDNMYQHVVISIEENNSNDFIKTDKSVLPISGLLDVTIVASTPTTTGVTLTVKGVCGQQPVTGLESADVLITTSAGAPVVLTSVTESQTVAGQYAVVFGTQTPGTYGANLANVVDQDPYFYAPLATATAFEIA
jgi:hypothetical protein